MNFLNCKNESLIRKADAYMKLNAMKSNLEVKSLYTFEI